MDTTSVWTSKRMLLRRKRADDADSNIAELQDVIIEKFNLAEHYGLKPNMKHWQHRLYKTVNNQFIVKRTQYGAISITVSDWDSQLAADICNEIVAQLDTFKNRVERERAQAAYHLLEKQLEEIDREMQRINDSLSVLAENGVLVLDRQAERLTQQLAIAIAQGNQGAVARLEKRLKNLLNGVLLSKHYKMNNTISASINPWQNRN